MQATDRRQLAYSYYVAGLLSVTYMFAFMDRVLIGILIEPIRADFGLSDTQIGLLIGFGFVLFYALFGIPLGALADRMNRCNLILFGLIGWSLATSASAFASGFGTLMAARAVVGIGEAALSPAAISTLSDRFEPSRRGLALSIYASGAAVGGGAALAFSGALSSWTANLIVDIPLLGPFEGWRLAMLLVGLAGLPLALIIRITMREAPRSAAEPPMPPAALITHLRTHRMAFAAILTAYASAIIASSMPALWAPVLFMREHHMDAGEVGASLGAIVGVAGFIGVIGGGWISDYLTRRGMIDAPVTIVFWAVILQAPFMSAAFLIESTAAALLLLMVAQLLATIVAGLQATTLQLITPSRLRGRMMAIYLLVVALVGMGIGPLAVGALSDAYAGTNALGHSLATVAIIALAISAIILGSSRKAIRSTMKLVAF